MPPASFNESGVFAEIMQRIDTFDRDYSRFRPDSLVTNMSHQAGTYLLPDDARPMMKLYEKLYRLTNGLFTPLIGSVLVEAGYDANYSLKPKELHQPLSLSEALSYEYPSLIMKQPALLDFGGVGKGFMIDEIGKILLSYEVKTFTIDVGGDILHHDSRGGVIRVGLEHPHNQQQVIGVVNIGNQSICCSSGNRRAWADFHHIINPQTLSSPRDILSTWVIAPDALIADAIATSLFLVSPSALTSEFDFEYLVMKPDTSVEHSTGFHAELFTA